MANPAFRPGADIAIMAAASILGLRRFLLSRQP